MGSNIPLHRYGWLEHDDGMWHFLTDLFADAGQSKRHWTDKLLALEELKKEGWTVISPYPEKTLQTQSEHKACGYGLIRQFSNCN
jgi:hypothetical protein